MNTYSEGIDVGIVDYLNMFVANPFQQRFAVRQGRSKFIQNIALLDKIDK